jgi:diadenosine tetraphosphate (Ap4A) HIT family hydrolase
VTVSASSDVEGCLACDLAAGRLDLPGGVIAETDHWLVEHTVGPLTLGTLIVKPRRHVLHVWELEDEEARELGPLLRRAAAATAVLTAPDQIYVCLWSHMGARPVHIHFVVQPVTRAVMDETAVVGPALQVALFEAAESPPRDEIAAFADRARSLLRG